ncbi:ArsR family transcriptional regulator, partial [Enterococcus faecalis]|nr:ArsR family transcriptional regulator [Enterococcus faecalis]
MNPLLYNYFIDETSSKKNMIKVLSLLHELRIISRSQLLLLLNINANVAERTMNQILKYLKDNNLIDKIKKGNQAC